MTNLRIKDRHGCRFAETTFALLILAIVNLGCATYRTPAAGVSMASLTRADADIKERMLREPAAPFPARLALVRVQAPGYRSYGSEGYGEGSYSVVTTRETERDEDLRRLGNLPMISSVVPLNRLVIPPKLGSEKDLRLGAASVKADLLLAYSFDTAFRVNEYDYGPLQLISLGMAPTQQARVTTTAFAALFDVRTGYIYCLAETTAQENQVASNWTSEKAVDESRLRAERNAFVQLLDQFQEDWKGILEDYSKTSPMIGAAAEVNEDRQSKN